MSDHRYCECGNRLGNRNRSGVCKVCAGLDFCQVCRQARCAPDRTACAACLESQAVVRALHKMHRGERPLDPDSRVRLYAARAEAGLPLFEDSA